MITTIDRDTCRLLSSDISEALKTVAAKHGIQIRTRGGTFSPLNYTLKVECAVIGDAGVAETKERTDYPLYATMYGLKPEWLDKTFEHAGDEYTIVGLATRKRKNPIHCRSKAQGKTFLFAETIVKLLMEKQEQKVSVPA